MMKHLLRSIALLLASSAVHANTHTIPEGRQLMNEALAQVVAAGADEAARQFMTERKWRVGSMYVVLNDFTGKVLAHSANPKMVGKVMFEARDASGRLFVQECIGNLKARGESDVELKWGNPITNRIAPAHMLSKQVPGRPLYVSVLVFK